MVNDKGKKIKLSKGTKSDAAAEQLAVGESCLAQADWAAICNRCEGEPHLLSRLRGRP